LFRTTTGHLKVLDFGIARLREGQGASNATKTGAAMGTPAYMPPEQALGNWSLVDGRTDLWAVGATMFSLVTGRLVHEADTLNKLLLSAMTKPAPPIRSLQASVPEPIAHVIDRALSFDQDGRWPDARSMQHALRQAMQRAAQPVPWPQALPVATSMTSNPGVAPAAPTPAMEMSAEAASIPHAQLSTAAPVSSDPALGHARGSANRRLVIAGIASLAAIAVVATAGVAVLRKGAPVEQPEKTANARALPTVSASAPDDAHVALVAPAATNDASDGSVQAAASQTSVVATTPEPPSGTVKPTKSVGGTVGGKTGPPKAKGKDFNTW
jgi:serine/threonine-protein kinase